MTEHEQMLMKALSGAAHLIEFMDSGNGLDLTAAWSSLCDPDVRAWADANAVLLPLRRDGNTLHERLDRVEDSQK